MVRRRGILRFSAVALVISAAAGLSACQSVREALGTRKTSLDELLVFAQAPLRLPPDLTLRPPQQGTLARNDPSPQTFGKRALFPVRFTSSVPAGPDGFSDGEIALLAQAGALAGDSRIRDAALNKAQPPALLDPSQPAVRTADLLPLRRTIDR